MKSRVVAVAVIEKGGSVLLGKKPPGVGPYPDCWHVPGGGIHLEDESIEQALKREIMEETGLKVKDIKKISFDEDYEPDKHGEKTHYVFLVYCCKWASGTPKAGDDLNTLQWVEKAKLKGFTLTRPSQKLFKEIGWV